MRTSTNYFIIWKNGTVEVLTGPQDARSMKVPEYIHSPTGQWLKFDWNILGSLTRLERITDSTGKLLLSAVYSGTNASTFTLWPGSSESYVLTMIYRNNNLYQLTNNAVTPPLTWTFDYTTVGSWYPITGIHYPTGLREQVWYQNARMLFPTSAGLPALPAVSRHLKSPGAGQEGIDTTYTYSNSNYLGYGTAGSWSPDRDNLFGVLNAYTYWSRRTVTSGGVSRATICTYNNFHLQIEEETQSLGASTRTITEYYALPGTVFDNQPPQFQLPRSRTVIWRYLSGTPRSEITLTEFDASGNPTRTQTPDGMVTELFYYSPAGEPGCPPDPWGFTRFIRRKNTIPAPSAFSTPARDENYNYISLPAMAGAPAPYSVLMEDRFDASGATRILHTQQFYLNQRASPTMHGRPARTVRWFYDLNNSSLSYPNFLEQLYTLNANVLTTSERVTGHDKLTLTTSREVSILSGRVLAETDEQGNRTVNVYDNLVRPTRSTRNAGSAFQQVTMLAYATQPVTGGTAIYTTTTDPLGNATRSWFDGLGRVTRQEVSDPDTNGQWFEAQTAAYNAFGERVAESVFDYPRSGQVARMARTAAITYDIWGNLLRTAFNDGTTLITQSDPIALTQAETREGFANNQTLYAGWTLTTLDVRGLPLTIVRRDRSGVTLGQVTRRYDGLGRLRQETDEMGRTTDYQYDAFDRVVGQRLPDGSVVSKMYVPFSDQLWATAIRVTNSAARIFQLGSQAYDSSGRIMQSTSGGRLTRFGWTGASPLPSTVTTPMGEVLRYEYIPQLDNAVRSVTSGTLRQDFTWDPLSGRMTRATGDNGVVTTRAFTRSGQLQGETFTVPGQPLRGVNHAWSLMGSQTQYTDVTGTQTQYQYNAVGQLVRVSDADMVITLTYDALGRLETRHTADPRGLHGCTIRLGYDQFDREIARSVTAANNETLTISQTWYANDQRRSSETRHNNVILRQEAWFYDSRNRLERYTCAGAAPPVDPYGKSISLQTFVYDAIDNITQCGTTFPGGVDNALFQFNNPSDPTQLSRVQHSHPDYPAVIALTYDANGQMTLDEAGRRLAYDPLGRLISVTGGPAPGGGYGYDALNRLVGQSVTGRGAHALYYRNDERVNEQQPGALRPVRLAKLGGATAAVHDGTHLRLTATNDQNSLLWSRAENQTSELVRYTPWGFSPAFRPSLPGFTGERPDPVSGAYHLGNGYRAYNPVLMRFNTPDSLSPFGAGGINAYVYCAGDPVNNADPSGHISWQGILGIVLAVVGFALSIPTGGASLSLVAGVLITLEAAAAATGIASIALEEKNPQASAALGWASLALGLGAGAGAGVGKLAARRANTTRGGGLEDIALGNRIELGDDLYLFKGSENSERLIISSHGKYHQEAGFFTPPQGTQVRYGIKEGRRLRLGLRQAADNSFTPAEVTRRDFQHNYRLERFPKDDDLFASRLASEYKVDIITVRSHASQNFEMVTIRTLLKNLEDKGLRYKTIDGIFCRVWEWDAPNTFVIKDPMRFHLTKKFSLK
ncbi:RHS repeat-associated core domain-containing protein [Sodalis sp. RH19]|uniref:RHS repeat-associated core domain-containing protein n=1 Tax=Sodalis sp. RH19 TaxID=3394334 RepID=UPI0039B6A2D4